MPYENARIHAMVEFGRAWHSHVDVALPEPSQAKFDAALLDFACDHLRHTTAAEFREAKRQIAIIRLELDIERALQVEQARVDLNVLAEAKGSVK
jgi:ABC-type cobalamin/Fe3+-siderophores transport system ATPase subunit